MIPHTAERVTRHTADWVTERIRRRMEERLVRIAEEVRAMDGRLDAVEARLNALDREWDIERTLEANAATVSLIGLVLAITVDRRWLALPVAVAAFLLQHAVQGWCPPLPVLRRLGVRTAAEIEEERCALKAFRGDFDGLPGDLHTNVWLRAEAALSAVRR